MSQKCKSKKWWSHSVCVFLKIKFYIFLHRARTENATQTRWKIIFGIILQSLYEMRKNCIMLTVHHTFIIERGIVKNSFFLFDVFESRTASDDLFHPVGSFEGKFFDPLDFNENESNVWRKWLGFPSNFSTRVPPPTHTLALLGEFLRPITHKPHTIYFCHKNFHTRTHITFSLVPLFVRFRSNSLRKDCKIVKSFKEKEEKKKFLPILKINLENGIKVQLKR